MFINYRKGEIAVLKVMLTAAKKGYVVSMPTVEARYDMIIDDGESLLRVQVKYAGSKKTDGSVGLDLQKNTRGNTKKRPYTKDEIDMVLAYVPYCDKVVMLGPDLFDGRSSISLRYSPSINSQLKGVHFVDDLEW